MSALTFDSLDYARRLKAAGLPEPQAEVHAELMSEALTSFSSHLATREDIAVLRESIDQLRESTSESIEQLRQSTRESIEQLRQSTSESMEQLRESTSGSIGQLRESSAQSLAHHREMMEHLRDEMQQVREEMRQQRVVTSHLKTELRQDIEEQFSRHMDQWEARYARQELFWETRFLKLDRGQYVHAWILAAIAAATVVPQLSRLMGY